MITNENLIEHLTESFKVFTENGSRSDKKLIPLHGGIAKDVINRLHEMGYNETMISVDTKGYGSNKEAKVEGKYINKDVDITFKYENKPIVGINVKSIQQNYKQNSNNYFENMLGETANLQINGFPLFQAFIVPHQIPYFANNKTFKKWEYFNKYSSNKYIELSQDTDQVHVPYGTLMFNYNLNEMPQNPIDSDEYKAFYHNNINITICDELKNANWGDNTYFNNYHGFINMVANTIIKCTENL